MRHRKDTCKLNRTTSHRRCMFANMLKSLIHNERIVTTVEKAKALRRHADRMVTLAKKNTLATRRRAIAELMITFNKLSDKEERKARKIKSENETAIKENKPIKPINVYNIDRTVIDKLFDVLGVRFADRNGGYTRIIKGGRRIGDNAQKCIIEYLPE